MKKKSTIDTKRECNLDRIPNFLVIGAAKSGTTALWHQLSEHPQIYMHPNKATNFFTFYGQPPDFCGPPPSEIHRFAVNTWEKYCAEFADINEGIVIGEACNSYLYTQGVAERIKHHIPDVKIIAVLRHPVERAYSRFLQLVRSGREPLADFAEAVAAESERIDNRWWPEFHYLNVGRYYEQLMRFYSVFSPQQIRVFLYEDLQVNSRQMLIDIFEFIGVDADFRPNADARYNVSGIPKNKIMDFILKQMKVALPVASLFLQKNQVNYFRQIVTNVYLRNLSKPPLQYKVRKYLIEQYREDTMRLQALTGRDLSSWLK